MSLNGDGRTIYCDGADKSGHACTATMQAPVALRPHLSRLVGRAALAAPDNAHRAGGWLCMSGRERGRHYCPKCAQAFVQALLHGEESENDEQDANLSTHEDMSTHESAAEVVIAKT
jgi:hypothetical protein